MKSFVCLGKNGDVLSVLPILFHEFRKTGQKQNLIISKSFASIVSGCSYIEPIIFDGEYDDVRGALKFGKQRYSQVVSLQTHGNIPIQQTAPSFQHDQWKRAGCIDSFDYWPLSIDQRSGLRERILFNNTIEKVVTGKHRNWEKYILFADHSQSSPFLHKQELAGMLNKEFGETHRTIRLSEVRAERLFDMLALYERAACLVTVETAHLHLSRASSVPTIALAADRWRGSAYRSGFRFYCRYSEWERRKQRLIFEVSDVLRGVQPPKFHLVRTQFPNGYNLSEILWTGRLLRCYRYHPEPTWRTKLVIDDGESSSVLIAPQSLNGFSLEDARFFVFKDKLHIAYTVSTVKLNLFICVTGYGELTRTPAGWQIANHTQPRYTGNDFSGLQKNWTPFVVEDKLHFIYGQKDGNQIVLQMDGDKVVSEHKSLSPKWAWGEIRGGVVQSHNGRLFRFFHSRQEYPDKSIRYFVGCSILDPKPPFKTLAVSTSPILEGNEFYVSNCRHWKANVIIPYGCRMEGDRFLLSVGINDSRCSVVELTEKELKL